MAIIYQFPFTPEDNISEEQERIWDEKIQAIIEESDREIERMFDYLYSPPSDNPFEQMARQRAYEEFERLTTTPHKKTRVPKIIIQE